MEFGIHEMFTYPGETEIYVDEHEVELYLLPVEGPDDDPFRLIIDRRFFPLLGIDEHTLLSGYIEDRSRFRLVADSSGLRIIDTLSPSGHSTQTFDERPGAQDGQPR